MKRYWIDLDQLKEFAKVDSLYVMCHKIAKEQKLVTERTESLTKGLAVTFKIFTDHYEGKPLHLQSLPLTKNQYNNAQKLQYHGLLKHTGTGYWDMTELGTYFLSGAPVSKSVTIDNGQVIDKSRTKITINDLIKSAPTHHFPQRQSYLD